MTALAKAFLLTYNTIQLVLWVFIANELLKGLQQQKPKLEQGLVNAFFALDFDKLYALYSPYLVIAQVFAFIEVLQPMLGLSKGSVGTALVQYIGRGHIVAIVEALIPQLHSSPLMFITVVAWTIIELVRYPYYMLNTVHINFYPLLWLRYTLWIPLYPIGMVTETWIIYLARGVVSKTGLFSNGVDLYFWGLTLWLALVIYVAPMQLIYMAKQRKSYLSGEKKGSKEQTKKEKAQ